MEKACMYNESGSYGTVVVGVFMNFCISDRSFIPIASFPYPYRTVPIDHTSLSLIDQSMEHCTEQGVKMLMAYWNISGGGGREEEEEERRVYIRSYMARWW